MIKVRTKKFSEQFLFVVSFFLCLIKFIFGHRMKEYSKLFCRSKKILFLYFCFLSFAYYKVENFFPVFHKLDTLITAKTLSVFFSLVVVAVVMKRGRKKKRAFVSSSFFLLLFYLKNNKFSFG